MDLQFQLPKDDIKYLKALVEQGHKVRAINYNGKYWLLISDWPLSSGYTIDRVNVAIEIRPGYPDTELDMPYFNPHIHRSDGILIPQTQVREQIDGIDYQRWSRHRSSGNISWRPGLDCIRTHLIYIDSWFKREFKQRPIGRIA